MSKPYIHAQSSVTKFGGKAEDYIEIHNLLDSSKGIIPDHRHRALTHTSWFLFILEKIFGATIKNSDGTDVSVRDIGEQHILEDFKGFIPTAQDFIMAMSYEPWMNNGAEQPPSIKSKPVIKPFKDYPHKDIINTAVFDGSQMIIDGGAGPKGGCKPLFTPGEDMIVDGSRQIKIDDEKPIQFNTISD